MSAIQQALSTLHTTTKVLKGIEDTEVILESIQIYQATHIMCIMRESDYLWLFMQHMSELLGMQKCGMQTITIEFDKQMSIFGALIKFIRMFDTSSNLKIVSFDSVGYMATFSYAGHDELIGIRARHACMDYWNAYKFEVYYEVEEVINEKPEIIPEAAPYFNGSVIAKSTEDPGSWTVGRIYTIVNGVIDNNKGRAYTGIESIEHLNKSGTVFESALSVKY